MIDTIVMRLHNLEKHVDIKNMLEFDGVDAYTQFIKQVKTKDLLVNNINSQKQMIKYGNGQVNVSKRKGHYELPSHHYDLAFHIDYQKDYIEFNFSMPKFLYGNNVAQIVKDSQFNFVLSKWMDFNNQFSICYDEFLDTIKFFFYHVFERNNKSAVADLTDVEIVRFDLCFNQFFPTKEDAINYINYQVRLFKKFERKTTDKGESYKTSFYYNMPGCFMKIYHKGSEYNKHDRKKHIDKNETVIEDSTGVRSLDIFDIDFLQSVADRIVRYEVEFKTKKLSEIFNKKIIRLHNPLFNMKYKVYEQTRRETKDGEETIRFDVDGVVTWEVDKDALHIYKKVKKAINKQKRFMLLPKFIENNRGRKIKDSSYYNPTSILALLDKGLFNECIVVFKSFINHFQVKKLTIIDLINEKVGVYNAEIDKKREQLKLEYAKMGKEFAPGELTKLSGSKLDASKMAMIVKLIQTYGSLSDVRRYVDINPSTYRNYRQKLGKIGIHENMFTDLVEVNAPLDYREYYKIEKENYGKIKPKL